MSTYYHIASGAAVAIGSSKFIGLQLWSNSMFAWMLVLIIASNLSDKDALWSEPLKYWAGQPDNRPWMRKLKSWALWWFDHRRFFHSPLALALDYFFLNWFCATLTACCFLPSISGERVLLFCLVKHLICDMPDGSEGVPWLFPFSDRMFRLPALFKDVGWAAMRSENPQDRADFRQKARWETALTAVNFGLAGIVYLF